MLQRAGGLSTHSVCVCVHVCVVERVRVNVYTALLAATAMLTVPISQGYVLL